MIGTFLQSLIYRTTNYDTKKYEAYVRIFSLGTIEKRQRKKEFYSLVLLKVKHLRRYDAACWSFALSLCSSTATVLLFLLLSSLSLCIFFQSIKNSWSDFSLRSTSMMSPIFSLSLFIKTWRIQVFVWLKSLPRSFPYWKEYCGFFIY